MSHFKYEKPSAVEISEKELEEIAAVLSSGGGSSSATGDGFEDCIHQSAGFLDGTIGHTIKQLASLIDAKYGGATSIKSAWMFFRVIGGLSYSDEWMDDLQWDDVAGPLPYSSAKGEGDAVPVEEESFFVNTLGMSQLRYRVLRFYIRLQHFLCGMETLDQSTKSSSRDTFFNTLGSLGDFYYTNASGRRVKITKSNYGTFLEMNFSSMKGKCDFAHLCITTAAILADKAGFTLHASNLVIAGKFTDLCNQCTSDVARKDLSGWLGDSCLISGGASAISMGSDDYYSDMDAVSIALATPSLGYRAAIDSYYNKLRSTSRRDIFLSEYVTFSVAVKRMRLTYAGGSSMTDAQWLAHISADSRFADTLKFYRILEGTAVEPIA